MKAALLSVCLEGRACRKGKKVTVGKANGSQIVGTFKVRLKQGTLFRWKQEISDGS